MKKILFKIQQVKRELDRLPVREARRRNGASRIWSEAKDMLAYVRHLPPEELLKIRLHTGLFTGENVLGFWHPPQPIDPNRFAALSGYEQLTRGLSAQYRVGEPVNTAVPMPLGVQWRGRGINKDTARFQAFISNLKISGVLDWLRRRRGPLRVMEIGAGYGGAALHLRRTVDRPATIFLVDLTEMLYFSAAYLSAADPGTPVRVLRPDGTNARTLLATPGYVLVPIESLPLLRDQRLDLAVNLMSFQEMTPAVINGYLDLLARNLDGFFYSYNMERHPHNREMKQQGLTALLSRKLRLFPDPDVYRKPVLGAKHPWYYRTYIGWRPGSEARLPATAECWLRVYGPPQSDREIGHHPQVWHRHRSSPTKTQ